MFPTVLVCNRDLFSLNRFMTFEQRYTTVVFIYIDALMLQLTCIRRNLLQTGKICQSPFSVNMYLWPFKSDKRKRII